MPQKAKTLPFSDNVLLFFPLASPENPTSVGPPATALAASHLGILLRNLILESVVDILKHYSIEGSDQMEEFELYVKLDDVTCPICLDFPHNGVLLQCSSYDKGCRPFVCDTDQLHSNCLDRFKQAYGNFSGSDSPLRSDATTSESMNLTSLDTSGKPVSGKPTCPLCRGEVTGWIVVDDVRKKLDGKKRSCEEEKCTYKGTYMELQKHAQLEHPHSCPSKIDPARQVDWENFQQSSEIIDVLSTIHSEVPRGVVLGDYVIEYGDYHSEDEFEDFPRDEGNWWTSCILYHVFDNFRTSRNRRRSRVSNSRRGNRHLSYASNSDEGSVTSVEYPDYRAEEVDDEFVNSRGPPRFGADHHSYRRRRSRFHDS